MKWPLLPVAMLYIGGLLLADWMVVAPPYLFALAFVLAFASLGWSAARPHLLWALIFTAGWCNLNWRAAILSPDDLRNWAAETAHLVVVRGTLNETPTLRVADAEDESSAHTLARLEAHAVRSGTKPWQRAVGCLMVRTPGVLPGHFFGGQAVEINGVLRPPRSPLAEGLFDYRTYLQRQGIYYELVVEDPNDWRLEKPDDTTRQPPLTDRFLAWGKDTLERGLPERDEALRLQLAMALGWKTALTDEVSEPFMRSGTMHIFAISGLHIALIAGILVALVRVLQVPRSACGALVIPLIWFYTAATGWQASAIRATVMMTLIIAGWAIRRPSNLLNSLAAAALIVLLWDPQQLFQASFQLSFFVVLSLALFLPVLDSIRKRLLEPDPLLPAQLRPRWQPPLLAATHYVSAGFITSLAAWLGSIPLVAYYFHLFGPVTLLANLLVVPLSSLALATSLGSLICGAWLPAVTELFNHSGWLWMRWMVGLSEWATTLPAAYFYVRAPAAGYFLAYYLLLFALLGGWLFKPALRIWVALLLVTAMTAAVWQWRESRALVKLTVLPLNGGHAIFFDAPGQANDLLIDCGNTNAAAFITRPFLRGQGVNRLAALLLTHGDVRHIGGTELITTDFQVKKVIASRVRFRSPTYRQIVDALRGAPDKLQTLEGGGQTGIWKVLHPAAHDNFPQADDNALVLQGEVYGTSLLLLADLGRPGQKALLERNPGLRADVVVSGLPNQGEPLSDALLEAVRPRLIIVADAEFPATERAGASLRERLARWHVPVIYMRTNDAVTLRFQPKRWEAATVRGWTLPGAELSRRAAVASHSPLKGETVSE